MADGNAGNVKVNLTFTQQGHAPVSFKVKGSVKLESIMKRYAQECNQQYDSLRAVTEDGNRYDVKKSVMDLGLNDGDEIEVRCEQTGGAASRQP